MTENSTNDNKSYKVTSSVSGKSLKFLKTDKPTTTLFVSGLTKSVSDSDVKEALRIDDECHLFRFSDENALIECPKVSVASELLNTVVNVNDNCQLDICYSSKTIAEYKRRTNVTKILHFFITKANFAITVDVLYKICIRYGKIVRIVVGKKNQKDNSIEALIEFLSDTDAKHVRENLDGNDIYSGCCSLKLSFSKIPRIYTSDKNDSESFDYSLMAKFGGCGIFGGLPPLESLINTPPPAFLPPMAMPYSFPPIFTPPLYPPMHYGVQQPFLYSPHVMQIDEKQKQNISASNNSWMFYKSDPTIQETIEGVVLLCRNFNSKIKSDNLFNLFCLFGNVEKIKLGPFESDGIVAYIQMANREGAEICRKLLNGLRIFDKTLEVSQTKFSELTDTIPNTNPTKTYFSDLNNRFKLSGQQPNKCRVYCPSPTLHFFNVPSNFTAAEIADVFVSAKVKDPSQVLMFPAKSSGGRQRGSLATGLIEFDTLEEAVEGIVMVNHTRLLLPKIKHPFHIKLVFSPTKISEKHSQTAVASSSMIEVTVDKPTKRERGDGGDEKTCDEPNAKVTKKG